MSKEKLTIENNELDKFKSCAELAGLRVLEVQNLGALNQVQVYYKTGQQLLMCGRYMEKLHEQIVIPLKKVPPSKKKTKS